MAPPIKCSCGTCKRCKHREYMREYYHRSTNPKYSSGGTAETPCAGCGKPITRTVRKLEWKDGKAFCSRSCKDRTRYETLRREREQAKPERNCRHCGKSMPKSMRADAAYCSNNCNVAAHSQAAKASKRTGAKEKRVDRAYVIARDKGRCHLCGKYPKGRDLTIDHVIPLSRGGQHVSENLRVACLSCNAAKRDRGANDQPFLFG